MRGLKVLRAFRVFKMFRYVSSLRVIGEVLLSSLSSFTSIAALLCLFTVVFAILGLHVFGGTNTDPANHFVYGVDDPSLGGRAGFDTFYHSLLAVFQVLTLEDWEFIMFKSVTYAGWSASVFFVSWVIVGKYTFLTLFLAVTMEAFESKYDAHAGEEARAVAELVKTARARRRRRFAELRRRKKEKERRRLHLLEKQTTDGDDTGETGGKLALTTVSVTGGERLPETFFKTSSEASSGDVSLKKNVLKNDDDGPFSARGRGRTASAFTSGSASPASPYSGSSTPGGFVGYDSRLSAFYDSGSITPPALASGAATPSLRWNAAGLDGLESVVGSARPSGFQASSSSMMVAHSRRAAGRANKAADLAEWSCFCVPPHHKWREAAYDLVKHEAFERVMFLLIGVQCVVMALERPGMEKSLERTLKRVDLALAVCFALEVSLKSFAFGLRRFLRERVNRLDLCIVLFAILEICLTSAGGLGAIRSLRILRAIRPLRALTKSPGMRMVLKSVALSVGAMANVSAVLLLVFVVFGILGVQIFAGRFYRCDDPTVPNKAACVGTYVHPVTGITLQRTWANAYLNFDSLPRRAGVAVRRVHSGRVRAAPVRRPGRHRRRRTTEARRESGAFFFFLAFIVLCAFALLNLYVGVIFYQFSRIRTLSQTSSLDLTEAQKEWGEMCRTVLRMRRRKKMPLPANPLRRIPYRVASHEKFENGVFLALIAAAAVTATRTRDELPYVTDAREHAEVFFFVVFACEALLKCTAVGFKEYWREP